MRAAFLETPGKISISDVPYPSCGTDEVIIKMFTTGICGSDLHYFKYGRVGENVVKGPHILGHESSGEVVECGKDVENLRRGDKVAVEPGIPCLKCQYCLTGRYNLCISVKFLGAPPHHGTFREFISHKSLFAKKIPDSVSFREAAFVEPLAVGYNAAGKASVKPGEHVLIIGAGTIGLSCLQMVKIAGAGRVCVADIDEYRLQIALQLGADEIVVSGRQEVPVQQFDCVIEAAGAPEVINTTVEAVKKGGRIIIVGMSNEPYILNSMMLLRKEAALITVYRYANVFEPVLDLLALGRLKVEPMISHIFQFQDIAEAFRTAGNAEVQKQKVLVET